MDIEPALVILFLALNLIAFIIMGNDKRIARQRDNFDRTPEGILFFLATCGGAVGIYLGMQLFRHKTRKWYFELGIPLLMLQNILLLRTISQFFW